MFIPSIRESCISNIVKYCQTFKMDKLACPLPYLWNEYTTWLSIGDRKSKASSSSYLSSGQSFLFGKKYGCKGNFMLNRLSPIKYLYNNCHNWWFNLYWQNYGAGGSDRDFGVQTSSSYQSGATRQHSHPESYSKRKRGDRRRRQRNRRKKEKSI